MVEFHPIPMRIKAICTFRVVGPRVITYVFTRLECGITFLKVIKIEKLLKVIKPGEKKINS